MIKITPLAFANPVTSLSWAVRSNILQVVKDGMREAENISKTRFLSGMGRAKATLNVRSGHLRDSVVGEGHKGPKGYIAIGTLSSDAEYAAIHEYGGIIRHPGAKAHFYYLKFYSKLYKRWYRLLEIPPHDIPIPERSFLRAAMVEVEPHIVALVDKAIDKAIKESSR